MTQFKLITPPRDIADLLCMQKSLKYCKGLRTPESQANYEKCLQDKEYLKSFGDNLEKDIKESEKGYVIRKNDFSYDFLLQNIPTATHYIIWFCNESLARNLQEYAIDKVEMLGGFEKFNYIVWINNPTNQSVPNIRHAQLITFLKTNKN